MLNQKTKVDREKIRLIRSTNRLTIKQVADVLGLSGKQYGSKERGRYPFLGDELALLADFFEVDPGFFYTKDVHNE